MDIQRYKFNGRYHNVVVHNNTVYLAGRVVENGTTVKEQTKLCLEGIAETLEQYGSSKELMLSATVFLTDVTKFGELNESWVEFFGQEIAPARAVVIADLSEPQYLVEISVIAATK